MESTTKASAKKPSDAGRSPKPPRPNLPPTEPASDLWKYVGAAALVAGPAGYMIRKTGLEKEGEIAELKASGLKLHLQGLNRDQLKAKREELTMQQERLGETAGIQISVGTSLVFLALGAAVMAVLLVRRVRPRRAILALAPGALLGALWSVYEAGIYSMIPAALVAVGIIFYATGEPDPYNPRAFEEFRRFPMRRRVAPELTSDARYSSIRKLANELDDPRVLKRVTSIPSELTRILPSIGEGSILGFLQLRRQLAYVAFVEADDHNTSHYVSVIMQLDAPAPRFTAQPLPIVDGVPVPNTGIKVADDEAFTASYWVQVPPNQDARAVRAFLAPVVREELVAFPVVWMHVQGRVMAVTIYGRFDPELTDHLVDVADVLFAEYGAEGGPSLLEPDDTEPVGGAPKKKRKKKKSEGPNIGVAPAT